MLESIFLIVSRETGIQWGSLVYQRQSNAQKYADLLNEDDQSDEWIVQEYVHKIVHRGPG